jgi:alkylation response protein AidB-like acyl-CoA dehydrogenase
MVVNVDFNDAPLQAAYRSQTRAWLTAHRAEAPVLWGPGAIQDPAERISAHRAWQRRLAEAGYAGVTWPKEFGGQGLAPAEQVVVDQEIRRAEVPGILDYIGLGILGPTIIALGSEEQKRRHLAPMLRADEVWCQLFSEPAAGSDLAGVQTRAITGHSGGWVIRGQKVWTSHADYASFGLMLARTSLDKPKHRGLTMFIVPMDADGVSVRPLRQISGEARFSEVFFDEVELDPESVVGGVDDGWQTALTALMFERFTIGAEADELGLNEHRFASALAGVEGACESPEIRERLGRVAAELLAVRFGGYRLLTRIIQGRIPGPEAGIGKITAVNAGLAAADLIVDVIGPDALGDDSEWGRWVSFVPGLRFAGGTEDILRNMIGERVLGLPPEPRVDKDVPFSELRCGVQRARS